MRRFHRQELAGKGRHHRKDLEGRSRRTGLAGGVRRYHRQDLGEMRRHPLEDLARKGRLQVKARKGRLWGKEASCRTGLAWVERLPRGKERQEDRTTLARAGRWKERQEVGRGEERQERHRRGLQEACPQEADRRREGRVLELSAFRRGLGRLEKPRPG